MAYSISHFRITTPPEPKTYMNPLTRLSTRFNSPETHRLLTTTSSLILSLHRTPIAVTFSPLRQFSTQRNLANTASSITCGRRRSDPLRPAMDSHSPEIDAAEGEDFVRIDGATAEDLSESIVRVDEPRENVALTSATAAAAPEEEEESGRRRVLPEELSRSAVMLACESSAEGGVCDVYLVGTAHVSMVIACIMGLEYFSNLISWKLLALIG